METTLNVLQSLRGAGFPCGSAHNLPHTYGLLFKPSEEEDNIVDARGRFPHEKDFAKQKIFREYNFLALGGIDFRRGRPNWAITFALVSDETNERTSKLIR